MAKQNLLIVIAGGNMRLISGLITMVAGGIVTLMGFANEIYVVSLIGLVVLYTGFRVSRASTRTKD